METRNGTLIQHTGVDGKPARFNRDYQGFYSPAPDGDFVRVQIMPPVPQRFEYVRKSNIVGGEARG